MKACFLMGQYPTDENPINAFTDMLIMEMANQDIECTVIAPQKIGEKPYAPLVREKVAKNGNIVTIYSPKYISYSARNILGFNTARLSQRSYERVVFKEFKKRNIKADFLYASFFSLAGISGSKLGTKYAIPSFVNNGESTLNSLDILNKKKCIDAINNLTGIISVSTKNKEELIGSTYLKEENKNKVTIAVNSIDPTSFFKSDRDKARDELALPKGEYIVSFLGHFVERKGVKVLSAALEDMVDIYSIWLGKGPLEPRVKNSLFVGTAPHDQVYKYLNASDVFVLPSQAEGCSNAILEALACGLPVISSDRPFNYDVLDDSCSILVDPDSAEEIKEAIIRLKEDKDLRERLSEGALKKASSFTIEKRVAYILSFIKERIGF